MPPTRNVPAGRLDLGGGFLRKRIGRHDRARGVGRRRRATGRADALAIPRPTFAMSSFTPITPVDATRTAVRSQPSGRGRLVRHRGGMLQAVRARARVRAAAVDDDGGGAPARRRELTRARRGSGAACARLVVKTAAALAGVSDTISARSSPVRLDAARDAGGAKPVRRGDAGLGRVAHAGTACDARSSAFDACSCSRSTFGRRGATLRPP